MMSFGWAGDGYFIVYPCFLWLRTEPDKIPGKVLAAIRERCTSFLGASYSPHRRDLGDNATLIAYEFAPDMFGALRLSPAAFASEMRIAAAVQ